MKKNILTLLALVLCSIGFSQKNFEGIVDYEITYQPLSPKVNIEGLKEIFGVKIKFYYKDGTYMREYFDKNDNTIRKFIYEAETNRLYIVDALNTDTVYYYFANEKPFKAYQIVNGPPDTVLGCTCPSKVVTYKYYEKLLEDTLNMKLEYYFCHKLYVNPDYYKKYYVWYDIIKEQKSVAIKFSEETVNFFKMTYTATKIDQAKVSKEVFDFNKNAVLIKQNIAE